MTDKDLALKLLQEGPMTVDSAYADHGIAKLSTLVGSLNREGHQIKKRLIQGENRKGTMITMVEYYMEDDDA